MANEQEMISTDMMTLAEQMELASVTRWLWPTPIEQLSQEEVMELGFVTMATWEAWEPDELKSFWADALVGAYKAPPTKNWADQVEDEEVEWWDTYSHCSAIDWDAHTWSQIAWGRCHCGCEDNESRFGAPSSLGM
tara:strand:+ start:184 stop:591 length:408 start_codon:yes stop_codon:yes gene_type:complete